MKKPLFQYQKFVVPVWFCIAGAANAQESTCDPGVYLGKIGNVPVSMALDERRVGSMYYRVSMVDMVLKQESDQPVWTEFDGDNKPSGRITLTCHDKQLIGEWHSLDGKKRFPVAANRSPDGAYNARRFAALKPRETQNRSESESFPIAGPKVQGSEESVIRGIQIFGTEPGVAKVNRLLWADLLDNTESILSCSLEFRQRFGMDPPALGFEQSLSHTAGPYVVVRSHIGVECGYGMRYSVGMATYRLTDGRKVDSSQWFKPELSALRGQEWRATPLAKLVLKVGRSQMHKDDAECFEAAEYALSYVYPSREGFVFRGSFSTPFQYCQGAVDVMLPYARLAPFLSAEGKRAVQVMDKMPNQ